MTTPTLTMNVETHWFCQNDCEPVTIPVAQLAAIGTPICADCEEKMTIGTHVDIKAAGGSELSPTFVENHDHLDLEALEHTAHSVSSDLMRAKQVGDKNATDWLRGYSADLDQLISLRHSIQAEQSRLEQRDSNV